jgi:signal transduction histidine kinase
MKLINRKLHGVLDYLTGVFLILSPQLFQFGEQQAAASFIVIMGGLVLLYSLLTEYEMGILAVIPYSVHLGIDVLCGLTCILSVLLLSNDLLYELPHLYIGIFKLAEAALSRKDPAENMADVP